MEALMNWQRLTGDLEQLLESSSLATQTVETPMDEHLLTVLRQKTRESRRRLAELDRRLSRKPPCRIEKGRGFRDRVERIVEANLANALFGVEELASAMALGRRQLLRKFKQHIGMSPGNFLTRFRLQRAAGLLLAEEATITLISARVGYSKPSYFANQFKKHFGMTPRQWREDQASTLS